MAREAFQNGRELLFKKHELERQQMAEKWQQRNQERAAAYQQFKQEQRRENARRVQVMAAKERRVASEQSKRTTRAEIIRESPRREAVAAFGTVWTAAMPVQQLTPPAATARNQDVVAGSAARLSISASKGRAAMPYETGPDGGKVYVDATTPRRPKAETTIDGRSPAEAAKTAAQRQVAERGQPSPEMQRAVQAQPERQQGGLDRPQQSAASAWREHFKAKAEQKTREAGKDRGIEPG